MSDSPRRKSRLNRGPMAVYEALDSGTGGGKEATPLDPLTRGERVLTAFYFCSPGGRPALKCHQHIFEFW
jgi:hypothetical protein